MYSETNTFDKQNHDQDVIKYISQHYQKSLEMDKVMSAFGGFCIYSLTAQEAEIITMAIIPEYQNKGLGFMIIKEIEAQLTKKKCNSLFTPSRQKKQFFDFQEMDTYRRINTRSTWYNGTFKNSDIYITTNISSSNAFI